MYITVNETGHKVSCHPDAKSAVAEVECNSALMVYPINDLMLYLITRDNLTYYQGLRVWQKAWIRVAHGFDALEVLKDVCGTDDQSFIPCLMRKEKAA